MFLASELFAVPGIWQKMRQRQHLRLMKAGRKWKTSSGFDMGPSSNLANVSFSMRSPEKNKLPMDQKSQTSSDKVGRT
jgi:hypothetical protein